MREMAETYRRLSQDINKLMASSGINTENLKSIQWSEESLSLCEFVKKYPLPQIVMVEEGFDGGQDENSLGAGQVLKIHTLTTERKALCLDRHNKEVHIPLHTTQKLKLRPECYDIVYQKVSDLSKAKPIPNFVEVTRGYYDVDSNVNYELSVEPGEILEVLNDNNSTLTRLQRKNKFMSFLNKENVEIKLPFDCIAGFKPLIDNSSHSLSDVIPRDGNNNVYPFHFEFIANEDASAESHHRLGILRCMSVYDDKLIIASCGQGAVQTVFMIPQNLAITIKVALGTIDGDPSYENLMSSFHNFQSLETDVQKSRMSQIFRTSQELSGFTYSPPAVTTNVKYNWETFDENRNHVNNLNAEGKANGDNKELATLNGNGMKDQVIRKFSDPLYNGDNEDKLFYLGDNYSTNDTPKSTSPIDDILKTNSSTCETASQGTQTEVEQKELENDVDKENTVKSMTVEKLVQSLRKIKMREYLIEQFLSNHIDGELFCQLDEHELHDLGCGKFDIKKLFMFKEGWRPKVEKENRLTNIPKDNALPEKDDPQSPNIVTVPITTDESNNTEC